MQKEVVSKEVMQELINKLEEIVNNYCHNLEYFTDSEVDDFFQASADEVTFYNGLINDNIESKNFLWSSKKIAEKIAQSILEANEYTNSLLKNISSIQLEWCETNLPTTGENNKIYILPVTSESTTVNTLNIWNSTTCEFISIGNLEIDLTNYYTKTETDEKLELKANADEVISNDKIVQTLDSTTNSSDTILSTNGLQTEMDKKIDKANIVTTIDSASTDDTVPSTKSTYNLFNSLNTKIYGELVSTDILTYAENLTSKGFYPIQLDSFAKTNVPYYVFSHTNGFIMRTGETKSNSRITVVLFPRKGAETMGNKIAINTKYNSEDWMGWKYYGSSSVADVPLKKLKNSSDINSDADITYIVKNGICTVSANTISSSKMASGNITLTTGLPIPVNPSCWYSICTNSNATNAPLQNLLLRIDPSGNLIAYKGTDNINYFGSFSYPVAES